MYLHSIIWTLWSAHLYEARLIIHFKYPSKANSGPAVARDRLESTASGRQQHRAARHSALTRNRLVLPSDHFTIMHFYFQPRFTRHLIEEFQVGKFFTSSGFNREEDRVYLLRGTGGERAVTRVAPKAHAGWLDCTAGDAGCGPARGAPEGGRGDLPRSLPYKLAFCPLSYRE